MPNNNLTTQIPFTTRKNVSWASCTLIAKNSFCNWKNKSIKIFFFLRKIKMAVHEYHVVTCLVLLCSATC